MERTAVNSTSLIERHKRGYEHHSRVILYLVFFPLQYTQPRLETPVYQSGVLQPRNLPAC
jgi:hypothetical protein